MAILDILQYPDPRLRAKCAPVQTVDANIRRLVDDMLETMYHAPGIGLAAIQVDEPLRIIVLDISQQHNTPMCLINPEIISREGTCIMEEGCLSVPGIYDKIERAQNIRVRALNREGDPFEIEADDILSVCIQHEIDHLEGKVFIDYLSKLKQARIDRKLEKQRRRLTL